MPDPLLADPDIRRALGRAAPVGRSAAFAPDGGPDSLVTALTRSASLTRCLGEDALSVLGISDAEIPDLVGPVVLVDGAELPDWAIAIIDAIGWWSGADQPDWRELAAWFVDRALHELPIVFSASARAAIADQILAGGAPREDPRTLLVTAPARAYAIGHHISRTVSNIVEFASRLHADREQITALVGAPLGDVQELQLACGDPHDGLRSVIVVTGSTGERVVYKTKDLRVQHLWNDIVVLMDGWFRGELGFAGPLPLPLIVRDRYAWVRFIVQDPARDDPSATARFMARMGGIAALAALLRANDLWGDNLITVGDQPFIIDLETMLLPPIGYLLDMPALMTGIVAMPLPVHPELPAASLGALTYDAAIVSGIESRGSGEYRGSGFGTSTSTDGSGRDWVAMVMDERRPTIAGAPPDLFAWWDDFERGYRCATRAFIEEAQTLRALVADHLDDRSRMIVQGTFDYYRAMYASWNGRYDADTRSRTLALVRTVKSWHRGPLQELPALAWVEGLMIADGDIPYFTMKADRRDLFVDDVSLGQCSAVSGAQAVRADIDRLGDPEAELRALRAHASTDVADHKVSPHVAVSVVASESVRRTHADHAESLVDVIAEWLSASRPVGVIEQPEIVLRSFGYVPFDIWNGTAAAALLMVEAGRDRDGSKLAERIVDDAAMATAWATPIRGPWLHPVSSVLAGMLSGSRLGLAAAQDAAQALGRSPLAAPTGPRPADGLGDVQWSLAVLRSAGGSDRGLRLSASALSGQPYWGRLPSAVTRRGQVVGRDPRSLRTDELIALGEVRGQATVAAAELVRRYEVTGRWLHDRLADDESVMSGIWGLVGVARTLLRGDGRPLPAFRDRVPDGRAV